MKNRGKIITKWRFYTNLERPITPEIMRKFDKTEKIHKLRFNYMYQLRNIENEATMAYFKESEGSPWFDRLSETEDWIAQEEKRLRIAHIDAPDTKWRFEAHLMVEVRRIQEPQLPLRVGVGLLPNWLRHKKWLIALDHYDDELCVFRCIAVHQGARKDRNTRRAQKLAESFFAAHDIPNRKITRRHFPLIEKHFRQGIAAYEINEEGTFALKYLPSRFDKIGISQMNIGIYKEHAFLITNLDKVTHNYSCAQCQARFTKACDLWRHAETCTRGVTKVKCPGEGIKSPETAFEKVFYPSGVFGKKQYSGLNTSRGGGMFTFIIKCVGMEGKGWLRDTQWMVFVLRRIRYFSFTVAIGMDVLNVTRVQHKSRKR